MYSGEKLQSELESSVKFESLQKSLADEEAKSHHLHEMKRSFVRYVSHEIRSPLHVVTVGLKLLESNIRNMGKWNEPIRSEAPVTLEGSGHRRNRRHSVALGSMHAQPNVLEDQASIVELVRHMLDSSASAASTLNDLLLYEKIEDNLLSIEPTRAHLFDVVSNALDQFQERAAETDICLSWDLTSIESVYTQLDVTKFGQVLKTLISNAIKFTPPNGSVHVSAVCIYNKPSLRHVPVMAPVPTVSTLTAALSRHPFAPESPLPSKHLFTHDVWNSVIAQSVDSSGGDTTACPSPLTSPRSRSDSSSTTDMYTPKVCHPLMRHSATVGGVRSQFTQSMMRRFNTGSTVRISIEDSGLGLLEVTHAYVYVSL